MLLHGEGRSARSLVQHTEIAEAASRECLKQFVESIVEDFKDKWISPPEKEELIETEKRCL